MEEDILQSWICHLEGAYWRGPSSSPCLRVGSHLVVSNEKSQGSQILSWDIHPAKGSGEERIHRRIYVTV